jgi:heterotetrameric sarcosine oxidase gamma subunit
LDSGQSTPSAIDAAGLRVVLDLDWRVASLRYFDPAGGFAAAVREALGCALPQPLCAAEVEDTANGGRSLLAWRSPTEVLLLTQSPALFAELEPRLAGAVDGCIVDQTGGIRVVRVEGARSADLLLRLGAPTAIPAAGETRSSRLAELQVLTACSRAGELLLLVERLYTDHLLEWIRATAADF